MITVPEPVTALFVTVKVEVAPPAMLGDVKLTLPSLPLQITAPLAAPDPVATGRTNPAPAAETVTFPVVTVTPVPAVTVPLALTFPEEAAIFPVVAVIPVPAVTVVVAARVVVVERDPGVVIAAGSDTVATDPTVVTVT